MKTIIGVGIVAIVGLAAWRIVAGIEGWFVDSGAGNTIMWAFVACAIVVMIGFSLILLAGGAGIAARMWVVRLNDNQYIESAAYAVISPARARALPQPKVRALPNAQVVEGLLMEPVKEREEVR